MKDNSISLSDWVDELQRTGRYTFTREDARQGLGLAEGSLNKALQRLGKQRRVIRPRRGFYVIVPLEYSSTGTIPPEWFINNLMSFIGSSYYVGCLSAAAIYGAAHQKPQELQVVVPFHLRMVDLRTVRIRFLQFAGMAKAITQPRRAHTGDYPVSTPEWTAIDLIRFQKHYGSLDAAATIFAELAGALDAEKLLLAAKRETSNAHLQRLGWMLEFMGFKALTESLHKHVISRDPSFTPLNSALNRRSGPRDRRWRVLINEEPQSEL